jgi:hypothetical protein
MTKYAHLEPGDLLSALGMDGHKWAEAFCELNPEADFDLMVSWFCNACMAGWDAAGAAIRSGRADPFHIEAVAH